MMMKMMMCLCMFMCMCVVVLKLNDDFEIVMGWEYITLEFLWNIEFARRVRYLDEFERAEV